jgi:hypothetical protein
MKMKLKLKKYPIIQKIFKVNKSLIEIGKKHNSDKGTVHNYLIHYENHFKKFRSNKIKFLEIGVGGFENGTYANSNLGGRSLKMWKEYFSKGEIFAIDIEDKSKLEEERIKIFKGDQTDEQFLQNVIDNTGELDLIIDDGSHINDHVIKSFKFLFPFLNEGGIYVIEDTQTSYWKDYGGDSLNLNNPSTMMNFFKSLTDSLNNQEFINPDYMQNDFDKTIVSIHFYHNLIFIYKGKNDEKSNMVLNNQTFKH